jgi:hypothetical protein
MFLDNYDIEGVTLASARDWLAGKTFAGTTAHLDTSRKEVIFINEIGHRDAIPAALDKIALLAKQGCRGAIAHTADPVMLKHALDIGFVVALTEDIVYRGQHLPAQRLVASPAVLDAWLNTPAALALTKNLNPQLI